MSKLVFSTGNKWKFLTAQQACEKYGIDLVQQNTDVPEIQSEDPKAVALDKAAKAYELVRQPLVITDDSWAFAGLRGFPGVYMHAMNQWLTPEDFLNLTLPLKNRTVTLTQYLVFIDSHGPKIFTQQTLGTLLKQIRGLREYASHTIIALDGDNGLSIAEAYEQTADKSNRTSAQIWHEFAEWFSSQSTL